MDKLISIIVPVYKVAKYLPRCIESILRQTYQNFELILVNDGSPDKSGELCDKYAKKDSRIRVIHKENGGASSARNVGMDVAQGEYIVFVDGDDWVVDNCLEELVKPMEEKDVQMAIGGIEIREFDISTQQMQEQLITLKEMEHTQIYEFFMKQFGLSRGPCAKIYKKEIISKYNIQFDETIKWGEDAIFLCKYWMHSKKIYIIESVLYYYNRLVPSASTRKIEEDRLACRVALQKKFEELVSGFTIEGKEKIIFDYKRLNFFGGVQDCCLQKNKPEKEVAEYYEALAPWGIIPVENMPEKIVALQKKDFKRICELYQLPKRSFLRKILKKIYIVLIELPRIWYLERVRDGLIKSKK